MTAAEATCSIGSFAADARPASGRSHLAQSNRPFTRSLGFAVEVLKNILLVLPRKLSLDMFMPFMGVRHRKIVGHRASYSVLVPSYSVLVPAPSPPSRSI